MLRSCRAGAAPRLSSARSGRRPGNRNHDHADGRGSRHRPDAARHPLRSPLTTTRAPCMTSLPRSAARPSSRHSPRSKPAGRGPYRSRRAGPPMRARSTRPRRGSTGPNPPPSSSARCAHSALSRARTRCSRPSRSRFGARGCADAHGEPGAVLRRAGRGGDRLRRKRARGIGAAARRGPSVERGRVPARPSLPPACVSRERPRGGAARTLRRWSRAWPLDAAWPRSSSAAPKAERNATRSADRSYARHAASLRPRASDRAATLAPRER